MKIVIIRHGKVDMEWKAKYDSVGFDEACRNYDTSPIKSIDGESELINKYKGYKVYISELPRTEETAKQLFGEGIFNKSGLFNEVAIKSFKDTKRKLSTLLWNVMGRAQWMVNSKRQPETITDTMERARKAIMMLEKENKDCCVISHGCFMRVFLLELRRRGYHIKNIGIIINNLEEFIAYKE